MSRTKTLTGQKGAESVIVELTTYVIDRAHIDWRLVKLQKNRWYKLPK